MTAKIEIPAEILEGYLQTVLAELSEESYSAYGVHTVLNRIMVVNGRDKVRPQMMYNYARNGLIVKGEKIFGATLRELSRDEVAQFIVRYCVRNEIEIKFAAEVNPTEAEAEVTDVIVTDETVTA